LTGYRRKLYDFFTAKDKDRDIKIVDLFESIAGNIAPGVKEDELEIIRRNVGTFVGAAYCLRNKQTKLLNLFSSDFSSQVEFQRQHFGYLLIFIALTMLALTGLKALSKDVKSLATKKTELEAKLLEIGTDTARYEELAGERETLRSFIANAKLSMYAQYAWADLFNEIQSKIETLKTAWIESLEWIDGKNGEDCDRIKISAKMLVTDGEAKLSASKLIEDFIESIGKMDSANGIEHIRLARHDENVLSFSFDIRLKPQSELLVK
jgi:hypothetical protein